MQEAGMGATARPAYGKGGFGVARAYALVFGIAYIGVALLEVILKNKGLTISGATILSFTGIQNAIHWIVGVVVLGSFFAGENAARTVARIVGVVFVVITVYGFAARKSLGDLLGFDGKLPMFYNYVHLATALLALFAGFFAARAYSSRAAA
jgi:uncharacterized protein DUF4383